MTLKFRIIAIVFIVLLLVSSITFAQESRFADITSQGKVIAKFDTESLRYENDPYTKEILINVWIKTIPDQTTGEYILSNYLFNSKKRQSMLLSQFTYDEEGNSVSQTLNKYNYALWTPNVPETLVDQLYVETVKYTIGHQKKLIKQYKDMKRDGTESSIYDKFNSWLTDIGKLFSIN